VNRELKTTNAIKIPEESRSQSTFPNLGWSYSIGKLLAYSNINLLSLKKPKCAGLLVIKAVWHVLLLWSCLTWFTLILSEKLISLSTA